MSVASVEKYSFLANLFCFGPYRYLIRTAVLGLVLLSLSRQALVLWQYDRVVHTDVLMQMFVQGLRADIIVICLLLVVPVLLIPLASVRGIEASGWISANASTKHSEVIQ